MIPRVDPYRYFEDDCVRVTHNTSFNFRIVLIVKRYC